MAHAQRFIALALLLATAGTAIAAEISESSVNDGVVIAIRGDLETGDDRKFDQVAQRYSKGAVHFESRGGDLVTGISIGEAIRLKGFITFLPPNATCASSCALAWLGGSRRFLSATSRLGFHSAYRMDGTTALETGPGNAVVGAYLTRIGLPLSAVIYITKAAPEDMTWLTPADAQKVGIEFSFVEDVFPKQNANQPAPKESQLPAFVQEVPLLGTPPQLQLPHEAQQPSPLSQPTQRQEAALPKPGPPSESINIGEHYRAVNNKVVELSKLSRSCRLPDVYTPDLFAPIIGKVVRTNFANNGVRVETFVLEKLDGAREVINVETPTLENLNMQERGWVFLGLQTMLHEGQEISGDVRLCGAAGRVMVLERVKRQGPISVLNPGQTSKSPRESQPAQKQATLAAPSVTPKEPVVIATHYKASGGRVIELSKLSSDCDPGAGIEPMEGKVAQTDFENDGVTVTGFVLEQPDGERSAINVEIPSDIPVSEVKLVMQGLHSILRQGQTVSGEMRRCGAAGRVLSLESVKSDSTDIKGARKVSH